MERKCSICGKQQKEQLMYQYGKYWMCWECHKQAQSEAVAAGIRRTHKLKELKI